MMQMEIGICSGRGKDRDEIRLDYAVSDWLFPHRDEELQIII